MFSANRARQRLAFTAGQVRLLLVALGAAISAPRRPIRQFFELLRRLWFRMTATAIRYRKRNGAMTYAALLTEQNCSHADLVAAFLGRENIVVTVRTVEPLRVLKVWKYDVRHAPLDLANDDEIHREHFGGRVL